MECKIHYFIIFPYIFKHNQDHTYLISYLIKEYINYQMDLTKDYIDTVLNSIKHNYHKIMKNIYLIQDYIKQIKDLNMEHIFNHDGYDLNDH